MCSSPNESSSLKFVFLHVIVKSCACRVQRSQRQVDFTQNPANSPRSRVCVARPAANKLSQRSPTLAKTLPRPLARVQKNPPATDSPGHHDQTDTPPRHCRSGARRTRDTTDNDKVHAIDAVVLEQCAGYAAIPIAVRDRGVFVEPRTGGHEARRRAAMGNNGGSCRMIPSRKARWTSTRITSAEVCRVC